MIERTPKAYAKARFFRGKALVIYGARQVGKTTFVRNLLQELGEEYLALNADNADVRSMLARPNAVMLRELIGKRRILFLDEVQRLENSGLLLKLMVDEVPEVQVVATGSSSFSLVGQINEPLTGRKYEINLMPLTFQELVQHQDLLTASRNLNQRLVLGSYPEIITDPELAEEHLELLANSYLYRDLFNLENVKKPKLLEKLVRALALQVGSEVNFNELGRLLRADSKTIEKYIQLLEEAYVIFTLPGFNRNVRTELRKGKKIFFYDNGIRNAVLGNLNPIEKRDDQGKLWENYLVSERVKHLAMQRKRAQSYFWRTTQQQEIDYVEEFRGELWAAEFKWNSRAKARFSQTFKRAYPQTETLAVHPKNFHRFLQR